MAASPKTKGLKNPTSSNAVLPKAVPRPRMIAVAAPSATKPSSTPRNGPRFLAKLAVPSVTRVTDGVRSFPIRSEEHTSELQSPDHLVCRLLLRKKKSDCKDIAVL